MLDRFTKVSQLNEYFENWHTLTEHERLNIVRALRNIGKLNLVDRGPDKTSFRCPINKYLLARPCNLSECKYHVDSPEDKNCMIATLNRSKNGRLSANEVSQVLGTTVSHINNTTASAISKIKKAIIRDKIDVIHSRYNYLRGHCVSCGEYIQDQLDLNTEPDLVLEYGEFGWCSDECRMQFPSWVFEIEKLFRCDYRIVLYTAYNECDMNYDQIDQLFNLEPGTTQQKVNKAEKELIL